MNTQAHNLTWGDVLRFWFAEGRSLQVDADTHRDHWFWRMQGGADSEIIARFSDLSAQAAAGNLDHWATDPEGATIDPSTSTSSVLPMCTVTLTATGKSMVVDQFRV